MIRITRHLSRATSRLVRLIVAFIVFAIVLLTAAQQAGSVGPWWLELSRYLPYPAVLGPAVVALLLSWPLGRWWRVTSGAALILVLTVTMGLEWHRAPGAVSAAPQVRVMTYNIKAYRVRLLGEGFSRLAREVALHDPDILVMQDAFGLGGRPAGPGFGQGPVFALPHVYAAGQYVVASRFPLRDCAEGRIDYRGEDHRYVKCLVDANGTELNLVTAHFESPRMGLNAARREGLEGVDDWQRNYEDRLEQARALARDLKDGKRPMIVAGDLNAPQSSAVVGALLGTGLRDAFSSAGRGYGYTHGHALRVGFSFLRIDHILLSPDLEVLDCFTGNGDASEHRPVIADLRVTRL